MSQLTALSLSIGVLGGIATWLYLTVGGILIWAGFIAWACFFHCGADTNALKNTIVNNIWGCVCAWVAALIILSVPMADKIGLPAWAGICVGVLVLVLCLGANIKAISVIPAAVYGFAATFAFLLQTPEKLSVANLTSLTLSNSLIVVPLSMIIGAIFGFVSGKLAGILTSKT
jgi:hypothetical protein